jgi:hypothetical protein
MAEWHSFKVKQRGKVVAEVDGPDRLRALREIMHYAMVYAQDGSVSVDGVTPEDWEALNAET